MSLGSDIYDAIPVEKLDEYINNIYYRIRLNPKRFPDADDPYTEIAKEIDAVKEKWTNQTWLRGGN